MRTPFVHPTPPPEYAPPVGSGNHTDATNDRARRTQVAWELGRDVDRFRMTGDAMLRAQIRCDAQRINDLSRFHLVELAARVQALVERIDRERADWEDGG